MAFTLDLSRACRFGDLTWARPDGLGPLCLPDASLPPYCAVGSATLSRCLTLTAANRTGLWL
jgi:hypothetical protein